MGGVKRRLMTKNEEKRRQEEFFAKHAKIKTNRYVCSYYPIQITAEKSVF